MLKLVDAASKGDTCHSDVLLCEVLYPSWLLGAAAVVRRQQDGHMCVGSQVRATETWLAARAAGVVFPNCCQAARIAGSASCAPIPSLLLDVAVRSSVTCAHRPRPCAWAPPPAASPRPWNGPF